MNQYLCTKCHKLTSLNLQSIDSKDIHCIECVKTIIKKESDRCQSLWYDAVSSPSHYTSGNIETIDAIEDWGLGYHLGNAIKYISRFDKKDKDNPMQDIHKAIWYLERFIENKEEDNAS